MKSRPAPSIAHFFRSLSYGLILLLFPLAVFAQEGKPHFSYTDLRNYNEALSSIQNGTEPEQAFAIYFEKASPGFKAWIDRYNLNPKKFAQRVNKRPKFFESLQNMEERLKGLETEIARGYKAVLQIYPDPYAKALPTYYFITDLGGGGSAEPLGVIMGVDYFGLTVENDLTEFPEGLAPKGRIPFGDFENIPQVAVHELVHWLQQSIQGKIGYESIYRDPAKSTVMAYAIREGGAEMIVRLATGMEDTERNTFGRAHERELWEAFKPHLLMHADDAKGWFSGRFKDGREWPFQIGYYMGLEITQYYYDQAEDKDRALLEIFAANKPEHFIKFVQHYARKFAD